jgi:uncharacterized protein (DUF2141 family)
MTKQILCLPRRLLPVLVAAAIISCMQGGSGSTTTNGFTASVNNEQGGPVTGAVVRVRPHDYYASGVPQNDASAEQRSIVDTVTGAGGTISVTGLHPGSYTVEVLDVAENTGVLIHGDINDGDQADFGSWTVAPCGALRGGIDTALFSAGKTFSVQVYGLERRIPVDPATGRFLIASLPPDTYSVRLIADDTTFIPVDYPSIPLLSGDTVEIDSLGAWIHYGEISLDMAAAGFGTGDTLFNVPLSLKLDESNFDFSAGKKKGGDLRITKPDGTAVPFETEWYDSTNSTATIWVLIDTLYGSRQTHTLHLYSGNREALSLSNPVVVFDTTFGYRSVWHFNESGGTEQKDATVNGSAAIPSGTMAGENDILGLLGRSQWFKGDAEYLSVLNIQSPAATVGDFSIVIWIKDSSTAAAGIVSRIDRRYGLLHDEKGRWGFYGSLNDNASDSCFAPASSKDWTLLAGVVRGNRYYLYVNGAVADSCFTDVADQSIVNSESTMLIGCLPDSTGYFRGVLDEVRIHTKALSPLWIRFCYETQRENQQAVSLKWLR